ncbi:hypothetical protein CA603_28505 [Paraburkholderia hospita]|nr:hypothetical protein CA603_28505 [Paraburkholderia hospita]
MQTLHLIPQMISLIFQTFTRFRQKCAFRDDIVSFVKEQLAAIKQLLDGRELTRKLLCYDTQVVSHVSLESDVSHSAL